MYLFCFKGLTKVLYIFGEVFIGIHNIGVDKKCLCQHLGDCLFYIYVSLSNDDECAGETSPPQYNMSLSKIKDSNGIERYTICCYSPN